MGSDVLTLFESFGDVVDHRAGLKNSIDLMYSTKEEADCIGDKLCVTVVFLDSGVEKPVP